ncbi:hypothetical protein Tco_1296014 [Tanacetum coccineum]
MILPEWRDLPRDNPLVSVEVLRNRVNTYAARITKMIADIEDRHHGPIDIEQVAVSSSLRLLEPKRTIESRAKRSSINLVRTQHPSETMVFHNEDGNPARANIKQALGYLKDGDGDGNSQHLRYQIIAMIPFEDQIHVPKPELKIEEKLLKFDIIIELDYQCDVEFDTTSVEA